MGELDEVGRLRAYVADLQSSLTPTWPASGPTSASTTGSGASTPRAPSSASAACSAWSRNATCAPFRLVVGATQQRTPAELARAEADGSAYAARLRHHFAHERDDASNGDGDPPSGGDAVARAIRAHGVRFESVVVREARRVRLPVALACAVVEKETGFRNVFGHDAVRNPVKSPPGGLLTVTRENYAQYLHHRRQGLGNQGVGPMQLTSPGLQDRADQLGGCWQPGPNIRVGLEFLAGNIRRMGLPPRRRRLQRLRSRRSALRRRRAGPRAAVGAAPA
jgi:hypothetical protein